ncbi:mRNA-degrading endonuclease [Desulfobacter hydrogenophilus]|uniref:mRNA-degrading endonuclease n=1 Tax=Desulfobacter hydrogenophilus TaxID=2291 RepID=A0A328FAD3_9BACT|nr:type II toxin-antitoxin system PemK/MazF family toxin [Desulfobacter hydrogenophilus]NDY73357.1 mRNA-degrading endonuclease [Desulfobacter hydrogenophilus]QBH14038.1 mRNA-degrading endonuclease [Desulfobacter hydrogenophilus]RAM01601.1 mRNA-degrading endonuclease [Desulfobacter hydrogenophilus]
MAAKSEKKMYIPERGDLVWIDFDPAAGHEQIGHRPALVLSPAIFNKKVLLALVAPVTSRVRGHGFEVSLIGKKISGVILCHQVKTIDFVERGLTFAEKAPTSVVSETLAKVRAIVTE